MLSGKGINLGLQIRELGRSQLMMSLDSLWLVDSELKDESGHYANFAESLIGEARRFNLEIILAGNRCAETSLVQRLRLRPAFHGMTDSFLPLGRIGYPVNPIIGSWVHYRELCRTLPNNGCGVVALAATANHRHFPALARWIRGFPAANEPVLLIYVRFHYHDPVTNRLLPTAPLVRRGLKLLERAERSRKIVLITDSERLAEEYRRITSLRLETLSVPHMIPDGFLGSDVPATTSDGGHPIRFTYLGEARLEKGYDLLVEAVQHMQAVGELQDIELTIHSYHHPMHRVEIWKHKLAQMGIPRVVSITRPLDSHSYYKVLLESDVIVMPYRRSTYFARSSGIFADALAAGKPVVTTQDTWMSEQLKHFGAGVLCRDNDAADLARALVETKRSFARLRELAISEKHRWIESHNMNRFFVGMMQIANMDFVRHA